MRLLLLLALASVANAQPSGLDSLLGATEAGRGIASTSPVLSDSATASVLTMLPGEEVYSLWGHSALRVRDPATDLDRTYNYGTFDFEQPGFVVRFLRGHLDYMLDTAPFEVEVYKYRDLLQRPMIEQTLDLPPETVRALFAALEENARPENRAYRYDFIWDNCSTRLLDMVDGALRDTGQPTVTLPDGESTETFRDLLDPYTEGHPWLDVGTNLGLGLPTDGVPTPRERIFLPLEFMATVDSSMIGGRLLVSRRDTLFWVHGAGIAPRAFPWPTSLAWMLFALTFGGTWWMNRQLRSDRMQTIAARLDGALFFLAGTAGIMLVLMWAATDHRVTEANLELLWLWPTHLIAAVPFARESRSRVWRGYAALAAAVTSLVVVLWWLWPEPMHPAGIPIALMLAVRAARRARG